VGVGEGEGLKPGKPTSSTQQDPLPHASLKLCNNFPLNDLHKKTTGEMKKETGDFSLSRSFGILE